METITLGKIPGLRTTVTLYDDIDNMPIDVFSKFNKYLMIDANIGSTLQDIDHNHIATLYRLAGNKEKTILQLNNFRQLINLLLNEINPVQYAFGCLVYSINGVTTTDLSDNGIRDTLSKLAKAGLTQGVLKKKRQRQKRNYTTRFSSFSRKLLMKALKRIITKNFWSWLSVSLKKLH